MASKARLLQLARASPIRDEDNLALKRFKKCLNNHSMDLVVLDDRMRGVRCKTGSMISCCTEQPRGWQAEGEDRSTGRLPLSIAAHQMCNLSRDV
jgi:hypothetical protein